jgi:hypothetical protein
LLPTGSLTTHYTVVTYTNWQGPDDAHMTTATFGGSVTVVGVASGESGTRVTVRLTASVSAGPGVTASGPGVRTFTLMQGDVLQLVASNPGEDLTGTVIEADLPVAVYTGHDCTQIPSGREACDHLEEQLLPSETWGKHYAVSQLRDRDEHESSVLRVVSQRDGNMLTFDGISAPAPCAGTLRAGQSCEFETSNSFQVTGSQPFLVMQYMRGQGPRPYINQLTQQSCSLDQAATDPNCVELCVPPDNPPNIPQCMGDPAMVTEVPVEQFRTAYDFLVPETYVRNFVNVVMRDGVQVTLDGMPLSGTSDAAGTGYHVFFVPVSAGAHHIETTASDGFGIKVYGVAPYTSYMYPGGLDLMRIATPG